MSDTSIKTSPGKPHPNPPLRKGREAIYLPLESGAGDTARHRFKNRFLSPYEASALAPESGVRRGRVGSGVSGFWDGTLGYPQAAIVAMTAFTIGLLFHVRIGYHAVPDTNALAIGMTLYTVLVFAATRRYQTHRLIKWLSGGPFAITLMIAIGIVAGFGAVLPSSAWERWLHAPSIFNTWPFWMLLLLMQTNLLSVTARRCWPLTYRNLCFTTSHLGLSIVLFGGVLSGASLERVRLLVPIGQNTSQGETANGSTVNLPFALSLRDFHLDSFPPVLALATADKASKDGIATTPGQKFAATGMRERIGDYLVEVKEFLPRAALVGDSWQAIAFPTAAPAASITVSRASDTKTLATGWVSSGSVDAASSLVSLGPDKAIVMVPPRPREYRATLGITHSAAGKDQNPRIQELRVNHPISVDDYRLYLLSYDQKMGAASEYAIVEAVRDRGIRVVYAGMYLLLAGAALMMWNGIGSEVRSEEKEKDR